MWDVQSKCVGSCYVNGCCVKHHRCRVSFTGVKLPGRGFDHPSPSSARVKESVQLYLHSACGTSWPVLEWTLTFTYIIAPVSQICASALLLLPTDCSGEINSPASEAEVKAYSAATARTYTQRMVFSEAYIFSYVRMQKFCFEFPMKISFSHQISVRYLPWRRRQYVSLKGLYHLLEYVASSSSRPQCKITRLKYLGRWTFTIHQRKRKLSGDGGLQVTGYNT
jgi:hypothetical protein